MSKKRIFAFLLAASLSAGALVSCGGGGESSTASTESSGSTTTAESGSEAASSGSSDETYQITMCYPGPADQTDYQAVMDAINELTME